jgi:hypothetical protein
VARTVFVLATALALGLPACGEIGGFEQAELDLTLDCSDGECQCATGFSNCDGELANGCENTALDLNNCGACGAPCGGECIDGRCAPLVVVPSDEYTGRFVTTDTHLIAATCSSLQVQPLDGSAPTILDADVSCRTHVAADGDDVFFGGGTFVKRGTTKGDVQVVAEEQSMVYDLALAPRYLYWIDLNLADNLAFIRRSTRAGGAVETVFPLGPDFYGEMKIQDGTLYWSSYYPGGLHAIKLDGQQELTNIFLDSRMTEPFALNDHYAYWSSYEGSILRKPLDGGKSEVLLPDPKYVTSIVIDDTHIYWTDYNRSSVSRATLDGGDVSVLAEKQTEPIRLQLVGDWLYWSTLDGIVRMRK